jgi:hypothetical protein
MTFQPMLACGGGGLILLILALPIINCTAAFVGGAVCSSMGNKKLEGWTMSISTLVALFYLGTIRV